MHLRKLHFSLATLDREAVSFPLSASCLHRVPQGTGLRRQGVCGKAGDAQGSCGTAGVRVGLARDETLRARL